MAIQGETYKERVQYQIEQWVKGNSIHNDVEDECCPDFSCCNKKMKTPQDEKDFFYHADEDTRQGMCMRWLVDAMESYGAEVL